MLEKGNTKTTKNNEEEIKILREKNKSLEEKNKNLQAELDEMKKDILSIYALSSVEDRCRTLVTMHENRENLTESTKELIEGMKNNLAELDVFKEKYGFGLTEKELKEKKKELKESLEKQRKVEKNK